MDIYTRYTIRQAIIPHSPMYIFTVSIERFIANAMSTSNITGKYYILNSNIVYTSR